MLSRILFFSIRLTYIYIPQVELLVSSDIMYNSFCASVHCCLFIVYYLPCTIYTITSFADLLECNILGHTFYV